LITGLPRRRRRPAARSAPVPAAAPGVKPSAAVLAESDGLRRVEAWFAERAWQVHGFQREAWERYRAGESGLINAPTGSGKTLAAWLGPVIEAVDERATEAVEDTAPTGPRALWITPLRALASDLGGHLQGAADALGLPWRVELRTGDTASGVRARQRQKPPHALITTPESLSVLLSYPESGAWLGDVRVAVVDEWHELLGTKRGVQLELALARLRTLQPGLRTWGLSATIANLEEARSVLLGPDARGALVRGPLDKQVEIDSLRPPTLVRFPWAGHLGLRLLEPVIEAVDRARTTLLFTNTRSQAELWHRALVETRPDWLERVAIHHGSIARDVRGRIESGLRDGSLKCVVCTSSLDLGVDFAPVDQVLQVGSPKGIARLVQRAGRSGHRPGETSRVLCVPTHALELAEVAAARRAHELGRIEARRPLTRSLDVLAQHLVTLATGPGFRADDLLAEVRRTHAYAELTDDEWRFALDFVTRGGQALAAYPQYRRVVRDAEGVHRVADARLARLHRTQIGTITSDGTLELRWLSGGTLGTIEESFLARQKPGDAFVFAGRVVQLVRVKDMVGYVRLATTRSRAVPRWNGGRMPLSTELADSLLEMLEGAGGGPPEMQLLAPLLELQQRWSALPRRGRLLVEQVRSRQGCHLFLYPFAGRAVHEGLATLLAQRLARSTPATFTLSANDYGFELLSREPVPLDEPKLRALLQPDGLAEDLVESLNLSEVARRQFRDIARIAGLVLQGLPGRPKTTRQLQASSGLIFDVLQRYDPGNLLLAQATREVLENQLEAQRLRACLARLATAEIVLVAPERLTPLSFPLWAESLQSQVLSTESWEDRVLKMVESLERAAGGASPAGSRRGGTRAARTGAADAEDSGE
jgi:ATP-dependent Lhr-like helicase